MKTFKFRNASITIEKVGYGQYRVEGLGIAIHFTDSEAWDLVDDFSNKKKSHEARRRCYNALKSNL